MPVHSLDRFIHRRFMMADPKEEKADPSPRHDEKEIEKAQEDAAEQREEEGGYQ